MHELVRSERFSSNFPIYQLMMHMLYSKPWLKISLCYQGSYSRPLAACWREKKRAFSFVAFKNSSIWLVIRQYLVSVCILLGLRQGCVGGQQGPIILSQAQRQCALSRGVAVRICSVVSLALALKITVFHDNFQLA